MKTQISPIKADIMLIGAAAFWGSSCLVTKYALADLGEFNLIAVRFLIGFVVALIVFNKKIKTDWRTILYSLILSANYCVVIAFMTFGVNFTTVSKAGFLTCLAGVVVPIFSLLIFRNKLRLKIVLCALTTLIGVYLLTMAGAGGFSGINLGDILCILCSIVFALQIILVSYYVKCADPTTITIYHMGFVGAINLILSFIFESPHMPTTGLSWFSVLWLGIICSVAAGWLQNVAQRHTSDSHAGIIFTLEPLFAVILAYLFLGEMLTIPGYIGAFIIFASIVLLEIDLPVKGRPNKDSKDSTEGDSHTG